MEFDRIEALRIGQELKKIRKQRGLSLAEVEHLSQGRWKAVVVGSYERADRAITIGRLSALMALYQAPLSALFPARQEHDDSTDAASAAPATFDLSRRELLRAQHPGLAQFLSFVINSRGDWNGHIITVRKSDLQMAASYEGVPFHELTQQLRTKRFLMRWH